MKKFFLYLTSLFILTGMPMSSIAQNSELMILNNEETASLLPLLKGNKEKFSVYIEIRKAYISGICILLHEGLEIKGSIFNEFGVSAIDFSYSIKKDKVKLHHVFKPLNKWYIKRILRKNLLSLIHNMQEGIPEYVDNRRKITYKLKQIK